MTFGTEFLLFFSAVIEESQKQENGQGLDAVCLDYFRFCDIICAMKKTKHKLTFFIFPEAQHQRRGCPFLSKRATVGDADRRDGLTSESEWSERAKKGQPRKSGNLF